MAGPGDEIAAGVKGRSHLRASHADRDQVIDILKAAYVQGRLAKDELDTRVSQTLIARTYGELGAVTADLPPGLITARPLRPPAQARARRPAGRTVLVGTAAIAPPAILVVALLTGNDLLGKVFFLIFPWYLMAWIAAGMQLIANWHDDRSRGQRPPPVQGGQALEREQEGGPGDDWIRCQARRDAGARHLRGHRSARHGCRPLAL
jgi:hypothetical protein